MLATMTHQQLTNVLAALTLHVNDRLTRRIEEVAEHGAAAPMALVVIWQHPGQTIEYLRNVLTLSHSGTVRLVERLIEDGLVVKRQGADNRSVSLTCTAAGSRKSKGILKAREDVVSPLLSRLDEQERGQLEHILRKLTWSGIATKEEGVNTCRLCNIDICFNRGNCPVTVARLSNACAGSPGAAKRVSNGGYDPADPDALLSTC